MKKPQSGFCTVVWVDVSTWGLNFFTWTIRMCLIRSLQEKLTLISQDQMQSGNFPDLSYDPTQAEKEVRSMQNSLRKPHCNSLGQIVLFNWPGVSFLTWRSCIVALVSVMIDDLDQRQICAHKCPAGLRIEVEYLLSNYGNLKMFGEPKSTEILSKARNQFGQVPRWQENVVEVASCDVIIEMVCQWSRRHDKTTGTSEKYIGAGPCQCERLEGRINTHLTETGNLKGSRLMTGPFTCFVTVY